MLRRSHRFVPAALGLVLLLPLLAFAAETPAPGGFDALAKALEKPLRIIQGATPAFTVTFTATYKDGATEEKAELRLVRADADRFALSLSSKFIDIELVRDAGSTRLVVPSKKVALVGEGPLPADSELALGQVISRMAGGVPPAMTAVSVLRAADANAAVLLLQVTLGLERAPAAADGKAPLAFLVKRGLGQGVASIELTPDGSAIRQIGFRSPSIEAKIAFTIEETATLPRASADGLKIVAVKREELELTLARALSRGAEILYYSSQGFRARDEVRTADRGRLVVRKGHRVAVLEGSAREVGLQHGKLLPKECLRLSDAVLHVVGLAYSVEKGEWFLDTIRRAWTRLEPHIPPEYIDEMDGLAEGAGLSKETVRLSNVFPELFHCSGFALFGKATQGGKLLHGRVLDYMTEIGLQRDAVVFVVKKAGSVPFANVGYAGFIGSVSGMNAEKIALGEMGGRGEGKWDGTPMAILMRMGLERAKTLDDACRIFREAKRTCEYYYVFSDGNVPTAIGVGATPEKIEFIRPGEAHPKLPAAFDDAVLMSGGDRFQRLIEKVKAGYGTFDPKSALDLMARPVAMRSNLHNVLFVPQDLVFYVANARGRSPACEQPYTRYSLQALLAAGGE